MAKRTRYILIITIAAGLMIVMAVIGWLAFESHLDRWGKQFHDGSPAPQTIIIKPGADADAIANLLAQADLIDSAPLFKMLAKKRGMAKKLKAGEYRLHGRMNPQRILDILAKGEQVLHSITFPPGCDIFEVSRIIRESDFIAGAESIDEILRDKGLLKELGIPHDDFEGYILPETYSFLLGTDARSVIMTVVRALFSSLPADYDQRAHKVGLDLHSAITMASLVESEVMLSEEYPLVSAVYHNRLKKDMPLQCDPTVIYSMKLLGIYKGNISKRDLHRDHPYNTYVHKGLPPGPICNPRMKALLAAVSPAEVDYLFFVSRNDGSHVFSTSYRDHVNAVNKYQRRR